MNFDELCRDFDRRRPKGPVVRKTLFFEAEWSNGNDSINDLLRWFLREYGYEYLNTINGDVWFLYHGKWCMCECEIKPDEIVRFFLCEFIQN